MLALSRKKNEAIVINNNVEITVLEIKGDQVKLGISAPKEVPVQTASNECRRFLPVLYHESMQNPVTPEILRFHPENESFCCHQLLLPQII